MFPRYLPRSLWTGRLLACPGLSVLPGLWTPEEWDHVDAAFGINWPPDRLGVDGDEEDEA